MVPKQMQGFFFFYLEVNPEVGAPCLACWKDKHPNEQMENHPFQQEFVASKDVAQIFNVVIFMSYPKVS